MAKKNAKTVRARYLCTPDGDRLEITGEDGKYWYCSGTQFFKRLGYRVETVEVPIAQEKPAEE